MTRPSDEHIEIWLNKIRQFADTLETAYIELATAEADVKKTMAILMTQAMAEGCKTIASQVHFADSRDEMRDARIKVGVCKGNLESIKVNLNYIEKKFEAWRTKQVNQRAERKRYGA